MRRTSARLAQLRQHLHRCKWRDTQAADTYWLLVLAQPPRGASINVSATDALFKRYYNDDTITKMAYETNAALSFLSVKLNKSVFRSDADTTQARYAVPFHTPENPMAHMVDDDPPIKTGAASKAYRDNFDRIFGEEDEVGDITPEIIEYVLLCGHPASAHPDARNYCEGAAEREGPVCSLGWPK
jgi:hypothetical protein